MPAKITYSENDGNTVPYPPHFDELQKNHGYFKTRGHPENVDLIPETQRSTALRNLLLDLASELSVVTSLRCDLGEHRLPKRHISSRWQAGGYVQLLPKRLDEEGHAILRSLAKTID